MLGGGTWFPNAAPFLWTGMGGADAAAAVVQAWRGGASRTCEAPPSVVGTGSGSTPQPTSRERCRSRWKTCRVLLHGMSPTTSNKEEKEKYHRAN